jgi:hypothetical protein
MVVGPLAVEPYSAPGDWCQRVSLLRLKIYAIPLPYDVRRGVQWDLKGEIVDRSTDAVGRQCMPGLARRQAQSRATPKLSVGLKQHLAGVTSQTVVELRTGQAPWVTELLKTASSGRADGTPHTTDNRQISRCSIGRVKCESTHAGQTDC